MDLDLLGFEIEQQSGIKVMRIGQWKVYVKPENYNLERDKTGKWMHFFNADSKDYIDKVCKRAVENDIVCETKLTDVELSSRVACFYINGDDNFAHKRVISFFLENNLIQKNKNGSYRNIAFKYDHQTRAGEYGTDFNTKISLSQFINLKTGEWLEDI